jgi:uncharacterized protein YaiL (DUF2058 family)
MSMSLRDQLLQAGLISAKQAREAERQQQQQRQKHQGQQHQGQGHKRGSAVEQAPTRPSQGAKAARDQVLNRQQQEKAQKKALLAQIKQLIEQNRLPPFAGEDRYNFVDGNRIRQIAVNSEVRGPLIRGEIVIVRSDGRYDLVPAAIAARIRERDEGAVIAFAAPENSPGDEAYQGFAVPDDLIW